MYINTHTYYSLRYGTLSPEQLVKNALQKGIPAMALTDINNTTGIPDFVKLCNGYGIKPMAGVEFRDAENNLLYIGIARNREGFRELNETLSRHNYDQTAYDTEPSFSHVHIVYPFMHPPQRALRDNEWIGVPPGRINQLITVQDARLKAKMVMQYPVTFLHQHDFWLHRHLRAIDRNTLLERLDRSQMAHPNEKPVARHELDGIYRGYPFIVENTKRLTDDCIIDLDYEGIKNRQTFTGSRYDDRRLLQKLAYEGCLSRYGKHNREAWKRVNHELEIIDRLGFSSYFLITWDIIRYSMQRGFYHVGRGSGANSIVAYCLYITDVDPVELNLYFERFINPKRSSPPDFDIDYSWQDRDEVLDYIFKRYGKSYTALLGTMTTFKDRSIFRELGKVYGLPKNEIDALVHHPSQQKDKDQISRNIMYAGSLLADFPNQRSIHAGGVLISEEPITYFAALDYPPKGMPVTQWDMFAAEELGFEKFDILSQRGIGHIHDALEIIRHNQQTDIHIHDIPSIKADTKTCEFLRTGEALGCFYIESPAMRGLLKKLQCNNYPALVAASSIIRPGVAKSGMMKEYIRRFHHPERTRYLHPLLKDLLAETYGIMVYQEDVIKVCHYFAGLDLSDADILRRAMSGKFRSQKEFERIKHKFFIHCKARGYAEKITRELWRQMESFAGYSFSKAHSASYAVESFQSLYLKAHFPLEFMVGVINNFGGFYRLPVYVNEVRRYGGTIHLPCVNKSTYMTSIDGTDVYLGLVHVLKLERKWALMLVNERKRNGIFRDMKDFVERVPLPVEQMILLIRVAAFRFTGQSKKRLLWEAHMIKHHQAPVTNRELFPREVKLFTLPPLDASTIEDAYDEIELLGFPVTLSVFDLLKTSFRGEISARDLIRYTGKKVRMVGQLVNVKNVKTVRHQWMHFGAFLDVRGEFFDTVHFPDSLKHYPFRGEGVYLVLGQVTQEFGMPGLTVEKMAKLPWKQDPRYQ